MRMTAQFPTARATPLMGTLSKHFGHKIPVTLEESRAELVFEMGRARLEAGPEVLHLALEAGDAEALERLRGVVESHLLRFAHRENPAPLDWTPAA